MSLTKRILLILILGLVVLLWRQPVIAPTSEQAFPLAQNKPPVTTLLAVGDIMLSRNVSAKIEKTDDPELPFANLKKIISSADISFGNLECPLDPGNLRIREGLIFRCLTKDLEGAINAGFDVVSTANNHALDQGIDNLEFTINYLKSRNILPVGTTPSPQPSPARGEGVSSPWTGEDKGEGGAILERHGLKFGFLAYSYSARNDGGKSTHPQIATMNDSSILQSEISNLKSHGADVIVVSMHAGTEYTRNPNQDQINFARAAVDAGADVVLGHHSHWIQTIEIYETPHPTLSPYKGRGIKGEESPLLPSSPGLPSGDLPKVRRGRMPEEQERSNRKGIIFYSLGNFVFDQMWSQETREGLMVELEFSAKGGSASGGHSIQLKTAKLIPVIIDNYCCPRLATEKEKIEILKKINLDFDLIQF